MYFVVKLVRAMENGVLVHICIIDTDENNMLQWFHSTVVRVTDVQFSEAQDIKISDCLVTSRYSVTFSTGDIVINIK